MKIVCLSNNVSSLRDWDRDHFGKELLHLTPGRIYDGLNINDVSNPYKEAGVWGFHDIRTDIYILGDLGEKVWIPYYMFEPLSVTRDKKLIEIGI